VGLAKITKSSSIRPPILRFLLGLRLRQRLADCADGAVGTQTRESGLSLVIAVTPVLLQLKNPLGEQEPRHLNHFGQGHRFYDFC
jgi:hypothetical protein